MYITALRNHNIVLGRIWCVSFTDWSFHFFSVTVVSKLSAVMKCTKILSCKQFLREFHYSRLWFTSNDWRSLVYIPVSITVIVANFGILYNYIYWVLNVRFSIAKCEFSHKSQSKDTQRVSMHMQFPMYCMQFTIVIQCSHSKPDILIN